MMKTNSESKESRSSRMPDESLDDYFFRIIMGNLDVSDDYVNKFQAFMQGQKSAMAEIQECSASETKKDSSHAAELGFATVLEYRQHLADETSYRNRLTCSRHIDDRSHMYNVFAMESLFIEENRQSVATVYPEFMNGAQLGKHSHQIVFDIIYKTCRDFDRSLVGSVMEYFGIVDILNVQTQIGVLQPLADDESESDD
jgi:hypothetical protein